MKQALLLLISFVFVNAYTQNHFTKNDFIPQHINSYKPAYQTDYPDWAKMMYQDDINYNDIKSKFDAWEALNTREFRPIRRYFKLWSRHILPYVNNEGLIDTPNMITYEKNLLGTQRNTYKNNSSRSLGNWSFLGPKETFWLNESGSLVTPLAAPWQVNLYSFDVAKNNTDVLYCGTETGYVNKTTDKGLNWQQVGLAYNFGGGITSVVIDPLDENTVYVSGGNQVHRTLDGGQTWEPLLDQSTQFSADRMEIDRSDNTKIFAAANNGVYISFDDGIIWNKVYNNRAYDIHRHPTNDKIVYALTESSGRFRVIQSNDGGLTFETQSDFPTNIIDQSGGLLAVSKANPDGLYALLLSASDTPIIYEMNGQGEWNLLATGNTSELPSDNGQGYFDLVFEVADDDPSLIFAGTSTLYKSSNAGQTFGIVGGYGGNFPIHPDIQDMKILENGEIWVATDGGMNLSLDYFTDTDNHFARINGIVGSDMWGFDQGWNEDLIVGGRYHNGNTSIADFYGDKALRMGGAESPTGWVVKGRSRHVAFDDLGAGWILPRTAEGQPEGRFIFSKFPNMDEYGGRRGNIATHPNYFGTLIMGTDNILWKTEDGGESYDMLYNMGGRVRYLDIAYSNPDIMYADVVNKGLMKSEDGGFTWSVKPALTGSPNGNNNWRGEIFFAISPTDENTIYACRQNGTWSNVIGKIFKSTDGGDTWEDWTNDLSVYTKNIVIQPDEAGNDIIYLFTNARDQIAKVLVRGENDTEWEDYGEGFPAGFQVNLAKPFFRDSKLRVSGNGGIWESPMLDQNYMPILNPWVEKKEYNCFLDTVYFNDHSIINHDQSSWSWEITPTPIYISDPNVRNPKVVLGAAGSYDVTMHISSNGIPYAKTIEGMVTATTCPSLDDCGNPLTLPKENWSLQSVDSEETNNPGLAIMAFDDDPSTIWHTRWTSGNDTYPHEMVIDMGELYNAQTFTYLPRQQGQNGRIKDFELYVSDNINEWGEPVAKGQFDNSFAPSTISLDQNIIGQYFKLVCLSEVNGNIWASAAEFSFKGCFPMDVSANDLNIDHRITAFPIPTSGLVNLSLINNGQFEFAVYSNAGLLVQKGKVQCSQGRVQLDLGNLNSGIYYVQLIDKNGVKYRTKVVKQ